MDPATAAWLLRPRLTTVQHYHHWGPPVIKEPTIYEIYVDDDGTVVQRGFEPNDVGREKCTQVAEEAVAAWKATQAANEEGGERPQEQNDEDERMWVSEPQTSPHSIQPQVQDLIQRYDRAQRLTNNIREQPRRRRRRAAARADAGEEDDLADAVGKGRAEQMQRKYRGRRTDPVTMPRRPRVLRDDDPSYFTKFPIPQYIYDNDGSSRRYPGVVIRKII